MSGAAPPVAAPAGGDPSGFRFSTEDVPERDRLELWREVVGRAIMKFEIEPLPDSRFHGEVTMRVLPDLHRNKGVAAGMRV